MTHHQTAVALLAIKARNEPGRGRILRQILEDVPHVAINSLPLPQALVIDALIMRLMDINGLGRTGAAEIAIKLAAKCLDCQREDEDEL